MDKRDYLNPDIIESLTQPAAIAWEIDPLGYFIPKGIESERIIKACGYIPGFIRNSTQADARTQLTENYGCGPLYDMSENWVISRVGIIIDKQSEDQGWYVSYTPLMKLSYLIGSPQMEYVYIYQNAYVAIVSKSRGFFLTRMD